MHRRRFPSLIVASALALAALAPSVARAAGAWIGLELAPGRRGGVGVRGVIGGSPGDKAQIRAGDEVLEIDGQKVTTPKELVTRVAAAEVGARLQVKLAGDAGPRTVTVTLEPRPGDAAVQRQAILGRAAPDFTPRVMSGPPLASLAALKGQVVLIDFFATWCGPCRVAMPEIERMHEKLGKRGLRVLGVSAEEADVVAGAAARFGLKYTLVADTDHKISDHYRVFALPTAVVVDRRGRVHDVSIADAEAAERAILELLAAAE